MWELNTSTTLSTVQRIHGCMRGITCRGLRVQRRVLEVCCLLIADNNSSRQALGNHFSTGGQGQGQVLSCNTIR